MRTLAVSSLEGGHISFLNQCLEHQLNCPSARIRHFLPLQRFALDICTPARLCFDIFRLFCCYHCSADRFIQVLPRNEALDESTEGVDQGPRGSACTSVGVQPVECEVERSAPIYPLCGRRMEPLGESREEYPLMALSDLVVRLVEKGPTRIKRHWSHPSVLPRLERS